MKTSFRQKVFSIVITVLVSVLLIAGVVLAATTIGNNIATDGNLTINAIQPWVMLQQIP
jgi:putative copper export protein